MTAWQPTSWQQKTTRQAVSYPSVDELDAVLQQLNTLPPLVTPTEIDTLKSQLADAAVGKRFILQGGDCAERFDDCNANVLTNKLRIILQMSLILIQGLKKPVTRVGRIAGQYAKPRSSDTETQGKLTLPSYRGDLINSPEFSKTARTPDPKRLLQGYYYSSLTLNYIRALINSNFANIYHSEQWDIGFAKHTKHATNYQHIVDTIHQALQFLITIDEIPESMKRVDFFTSHEALHLPYEQALTHQDKNGSWYNLGTHYPWIGMRTANLDGAHVEYMRGINNPIAVKIGPDVDKSLLQSLVKILNPNNEPGRLTLITRLGAKQVDNILPSLISMIKQTNMNVLWCCDPMHGNTKTTQQGYKTRQFDDILSELSQCFQIHADNDSYLGGVHFELTGEDVTECTGGARGLSEADLNKAYKTLVDPRLNYEQALEMAMLIIQ